MKIREAFTLRVMSKSILNPKMAFILEVIKSSTEAMTEREVRSHLYTKSSVHWELNALAEGGAITKNKVGRVFKYQYKKMEGIINGN